MLSLFFCSFSFHYLISLLIQAEINGLHGFRQIVTLMRPQYLSANDHYETI